MNNKMKLSAIFVVVLILSGQVPLSIAGVHTTETIEGAPSTDGGPKPANGGPKSIDGGTKNPPADGGPKTATARTVEIMNEEFVKDLKSEGVSEIAENFSVPQPGNGIDEAVFKAVAIRNAFITKLIEELKKNNVEVELDLMAAQAIEEAKLHAGDVWNIGN